MYMPPLTFILYEYMLPFLSIVTRHGYGNAMLVLYKQLFVTSDSSAVARIRYKNMPLAALMYISTQGPIDEEQRMLLVHRS